MPMTRGRLTAIAAMLGAVVVPTLESYAGTLAPWAIDGTLPTATSHHGAVAFGDDVFVFGGIDDSDNHLSDAYLYRPGGATTTAPSMPAIRSNNGYATHAGRAYSLGGHGPGGVAGEVWSIDPTSDTSWQTHAPLTTAREKLRAVSLGDYVHAIGGHTATPSENLTLNQRMEPNGAGAWQTKAPMTTARSGAGATTHDGKIYVFGGQDGATFHNSMEIYDPLTDTWIDGPGMITPRQNFGTAQVDDRVYVLGGETTGGVPTNAVEYFDFGLGQWVSDNPLPVALSGVRAVAIGRKIYALGGQPVGGPTERLDTVYVTEVVPLPASAWMGIVLLSAVGVMRVIRRRGSAART